MHTNGSLFGIACRVAAFSFVVAGSASLMQAQQSSAVESTSKAPLFLASESAPLDLASSNTSSSSTSSDAVDSNGQFMFGAAADLKASQPPPRRRYGRPNYSDSHSNADGSSKYAIVVGVGASLPVGNTYHYETPSWGVQAGFGRNFNRSVGILAQFDYDHFGLQSATLQNEQYAYNFNCSAAAQQAQQCTLISSLDGNNHVWSFTLDPTFTLATEGSVGAYFVAGGGFYHKVTNFTVPGTGYYYDPYYGQYIPYSANQTIDHYTSNAGGVNGGIGLTYKFSKFSNQRFYVEARYVAIFNQQRIGVTAQNVSGFGQTYAGNNYYPANSNRTTFVPITVGIRF